MSEYSQPKSICKLLDYQSIEGTPWQESNPDRKHGIVLNPFPALLVSR